MNIGSIIFTPEEMPQMAAYTGELVRQGILFDSKRDADGSFIIILNGGY